MSEQIPHTIRELDARSNDGIRVRLLWRQGDGRLWVDVVDTKAGNAFSLDVHDGERPLDVFQHPYAYAAHHRVEPHGRCAQDEWVIAFAA
jgi:hypothetical protein